MLCTAGPPYNSHYSAQISLTLIQLSLITVDVAKLVSFSTSIIIEVTYNKATDHSENTSTNAAEQLHFIAEGENQPNVLRISKHGLQRVRMNSREMQDDYRYVARGNREWITLLSSCLLLLHASSRRDNVNSEWLIICVPLLADWTDLALHFQCHHPRNFQEVLKMNKADLYTKLTLSHTKGECQRKIP